MGADKGSRSAWNLPAEPRSPLRAEPGRQTDKPCRRTRPGKALHPRPHPPARAAAPVGAGRWMHLSRRRARHGRYPGARPVSTPGGPLSVVSGSKSNRPVNPSRRHAANPFEGLLASRSPSASYRGKRVASAPPARVCRSCEAGRTAGSRGDAEGAENCRRVGWGTRLYPFSSGALSRPGIDGRSCSVVGPNGSQSMVLEKRFTLRVTMTMAISVRMPASGSRWRTSTPLSSTPRRTRR